MHEVVAPIKSLLGLFILGYAITNKLVLCVQINEEGIDSLDDVNSKYASWVV